MTIKTILFDIGDVLIDIDWLRGYRLIEGMVTDINGSQVPITEMKSIFFGEYQLPLINRFGVGSIAEDDFMTELLQNQKDQGIVYTGDRHLMGRAFNEAFEPLSHRIAVLNRLLTETDYQIALVSDTNIMHMTHIENYIPDIFKNIPIERRFYSHTVGHEKKNGAAIYQKVLQSLGAEPASTLMIDDRIKNQVGALELGMNFMLLPKTDDLEERLKEYGITLA